MCGCICKAPLSIRLLFPCVQSLRNAQRRKKLIQCTDTLPHGCPLFFEDMCQLCKRRCNPSAQGVYHLFLSKALFLPLRPAAPPFQCTAYIVPILLCRPLTFCANPIGNTVVFKVIHRILPIMAYYRKHLCILVL